MWGTENFKISHCDNTTDARFFIIRFHFDIENYQSKKMARKKRKKKNLIFFLKKLLHFCNL